MDPLLLVEQCYNRLPDDLKTHPWTVTDHGRKVLQSEDELNAYIASYGEMHVIKCRAALQNFPYDDLKNFFFEIYDWGCGQGLATLTLLDMLEERKLLSRLRKIFLIEPSSFALERACKWVRANSNPNIEIIPVNKEIPSNDISSMSEVSCSSKISINIFSNILDITSISLSWLAKKVASLTLTNYIVCVGPCFSRYSKTRIQDFCGYFNPNEYFSSINDYPYSYTSRTKHPFGCETKCFIHKNDSALNTDYQEIADLQQSFDAYNQSANCLKGSIDDNIITFYNTITDSQDTAFDAFLRPAINGDTADIVLTSEKRGIVFINTCLDLDRIEQEYARLENIKDNLFSFHLRSIRFDSILNKSVFGCVKLGLYFPNHTLQEVNSKLDAIIKQKIGKILRPQFECIYKQNIENLIRSKQGICDTTVLKTMTENLFSKIDKDIFERDLKSFIEHKPQTELDSIIRKHNIKTYNYLYRFTKDRDATDIIRSISSSVFKSTYYNELLNIVTPKWHHYNEGNLEFKLNTKQKEIVYIPDRRLKVKGVAGSGKTQVVAYRAVQQLLNTGEPVLIITFNITLIQYIRMRIGEVPADFSPNMFEITNYHQFFKTKSNLYSDQFPLELSDFNDPDYFAPYSNKIKKYKSIIIDEVQDFKEEWLQSIIKYFLEPGGNVSLFGDGEQNIYDRTLETETKMPPIRNCNFKGPWRKLSERISMRIRNPRIADLSSRFANTFISNNSEPLQTQEFVFETFFMKYQYMESSTSTKAIADTIHEFLTINNIEDKDTVILGQKITLLQMVEKDYRKDLTQQAMLTFETLEQSLSITQNNAVHNYSFIKDIRRAAKTHFTTKCDEIKMSTIHSFKGWESPTVIILLQPDSLQEDENERINTPSLIYTGLTRAQCHIFIINLGNMKYHEFFSKNIQ